MAMPAAPRRWTLDDLDRLPDDGNKYEVVRGRLFVTPAPAPRHEVVLARLARILEPYVDARKLGQVYRPRAVIRFEDSEVEPDLMVRAEPPAIDTPLENVVVAPEKVFLPLNRLLSPNRVELANVQVDVENV